MHKSQQILNFALRVPFQLKTKTKTETRQTDKQSFVHSTNHSLDKSVTEYPVTRYITYKDHLWVSQRITPEHRHQWSEFSPHKGSQP